MILLQTGLIHDFYRVIVSSRMAWVATSLASLAPRNNKAGGVFFSQALQGFEFLRWQLPSHFKLLKK